MKREFVDTFLGDVSELLNTMRTLGTVKPGSPTFDAIARALHSLKSGAAFLGWEELETEAHRLEDHLGTREGAPFDWFDAADRLGRIIHTHRELGRREDLRRPSAGNIVRFTELERSLLIESRRRGEHFYRLTCRIDPSEPLPFSRAYLLASKIETEMTLVKTEPPMGDADITFERITCWLTTDVSEAGIHGITNIDLMEVTELVQIDYDDILTHPEAPVLIESAERDEDAPLPVDPARYTELIETAEELAWRLDRRPGTPESHLSADIQRLLGALAFRPLAPVLENFARAAERLARRRGISARLVWSAASGGLDAPALETLIEILKQLIRNSIRHGIESADERRTCGKDETGLLSLKIERSGRRYRFEYRDDGRGIDEEALMQRARREGMPRDTDWIEILCRPGYSNLGQADVDGGRGLGLDMIRRLLRREFGSELELESRLGEGLILRWWIPERHLQRPYLVFLADGRKWALPEACIHRRGAAVPSLVDAAGQGYRLAGTVLPILGPEGPRPPGPVSPYFLEIRHRGRRAVLFVDDFLSDEPWGGDDWRRADPVGDWGRGLVDARSGIPLLSPALVYAAAPAPPAPDPPTAASRNS